VGDEDVALADARAEYLVVGDVVFLCRETARTRSRPVMAVRRIFGRLLSSMAARGAARRM